MEHERASEDEKSSPKLYLTNIQRRIQNKYEEMQKKIEKTKSLDSLQSLMDFKKDEEVYTSSRVEDDNKVPVENKFQRNTSLVSVEEIQVHDAFLHDINVCMKEENNIETNGVESECDQSSDIKVLQDQEHAKFINEKSAPTAASPPKSPKISIRRKIELKLLESKERRKRRSLEKNKVKNIATERKGEVREKVEKFILSNSTKQDIVSKVTKRVKIATVTVALIDATGVEEDPDDKTNKMIHCRFRFGTEKCKSKAIKSKDNKFSWMELFNLNMYDDNHLECSLMEKDTTLGRTTLDLLKLEKERTHKMRLKLDDMPNVEVFFLLTITGTTLSMADFEQYEIQHASTSRSHHSINHDDDDNSVGSLTVIVYGAKGLASQDCYCLLELGNDRLQTQTEYKTCDPNWMKTFVFVLNDITSILEITIQDEKRAEEVGKISISLLTINNGEARWYGLKDSTQRERAKGNNPRLLLEMNVSWHVIRAAFRTITPKEVKYLEKQEKLDRHVFSRNLTRVRACIEWIYYAFVIVKTCFEWESKTANIISLAVWMVFCWFFRSWMLPLLLLIPFVWYRPDKYRFVNWRKLLTGAKIVKPIDHTHSIPDKEEKTSLRRKIQSLQDMILVVQEAIGKLASFGESVKNLFNFTVPFLSGLAIFIISAISLVVFLIPVKYTVMAWSIHKFLRKILRPNRVPNNEILDLLSRVPDDEILQDCEELPLEEETAET